MLTTLSRILIPVLTLILPDRGGWFTSNFSAAASEYPKNLLLMLWVLVTGISFHTSLKQTAELAAPYLSVKKEAVLADASILSLIVSVLLPYRPETWYYVSALHVLIAFSSTVIFFTALTVMDLRFFFEGPEIFSLTTGLFLPAIAGTACLLIVCDYLISGALEVFLTLFSFFWLELFSHRVRQFVERKA